MTRSQYWMASLMAVSVLASVGLSAQPIDIGSRLELMIDDYLVDRMSGAEFRMHRPIPREIVMVYDKPWEGSGCGYHTIFKDGDIFRMYYKAWQLSVKDKKLDLPHECFGAYAESKDGIHWTRPMVNLFEYKGSKKNNIVWRGKGGHDFTPFRDTNPACKPEAKYKAIAYGPNPTGAYAFKSADGIHWSFLRDKPIITKGAFDTQNLAFWDTVRGEYRAYIRDFRAGKRGIRTATSKDFVNWTEPGWLKYPGAPDDQLYTNQIKPYYRAPHIFVGFPTRYVERGWSPSMKALPELKHRQLRSSGHIRYGTAISEGLLMTSRDGLTFKRWAEGFLSPGPERPGQWKYGDCYVAWHVLETKSSLPGAPNELSLYASEGYWTGTTSELRRYTLRMDGFVSIRAPMRGGGFVTRPLVFKGSTLVLNFATSAAGSIRVEIQEAAGKPIPGYSLADSAEVFGDSVERTVFWKSGSDVGKLAGKPLRLRFVLKDADLYSLRFR